MSKAASHLSSLRVCFGQTESGVVPDAEGIRVNLATPFLGGLPAEEIGSIAALPQERFPGIWTLEDEKWLLGAASQAVEASVDQAAESLYKKLLSLTKGWHLARVWNYVPQINCEATGLENYRRFNLGRWAAFKSHFGEGLHAKLPAASATGLPSGPLVSVFVATREPVRMCENPEQLPAWQYPSQYGPKSPSFARASLHAARSGQRQAWISGTASIKGHESIAVGDVERQTEVAADNVRLVLRQLGVPGPGVAPNWHWSGKVYLRFAADHASVQRALANSPLAPLMPHLAWIESDICRKELDMEIELSGSEQAAL